jgi:copper chaperone CopZ
MDDLVAVVPDMWADHHVLTARAALLALPGVETVEASARDHTVRVAYDPATTGEEESRKDKPAWSHGPRVTVTNATDLAMSGDYRKY